MKTIKPLLVITLTALIVSLAGSALAGKGAEQLLKPTKAANAAVSVAAPHRCASCTDRLVTIVDKATKGPNHAVSRVAIHNCSACDTKITTAGAGKAKQTVAIHRCGTVETAAVCCATK